MLMITPGFNHEPSSDAEAHYDKLRDDAHREMDTRKQLSAQSQAAYQQGDGARAKQLSEQAKDHAAKADRLNRQASDYIFNENNSMDRVAGDAIDLHGQYVEEAERILETRITAEKQRGGTHLHVIVGRGNHSANHVQKLKPAVEKMCSELGLAYRTEENEGRIYVDLTGNQDIPHNLPPPGQGYHQPSQGQGYQRPPGQQHGGGNAQEDETEKLIKFGISKLASCCIIM
jgi:DNA-nicking Smr family endonuclease